MLLWHGLYIHTSNKRYYFTPSGEDAYKLYKEAYAAIVRTQAKARRKTPLKRLGEILEEPSSKNPRALRAGLFF